MVLLSIWIFSLRVLHVRRREQRWLPPWEEKDESSHYGRDDSQRCVNHFSSFNDRNRDLAGGGRFAPVPTTLALRASVLTMYAHYAGIMHVCQPRYSALRDPFLTRRDQKKSGLSTALPATWETHFSDDSPFRGLLLIFIVVEFFLFFILVLSFLLGFFVSFQLRLGHLDF